MKQDAKGWDRIGKDGPAWGGGGNRASQVGTEQESKTEQSSERQGRTEQGIGQGREGGVDLGVDRSRKDKEGRQDRIDNKGQLRKLMA